MRVSGIARDADLGLHMAGLASWFHTPTDKFLMALCGRPGTEKPLHCSWWRAILHDAMVPGLPDQKRLMRIAGFF